MCPVTAHPRSCHTEPPVPHRVLALLLGPSEPLLLLGVTLSPVPTLFTYTPYPTYVPHESPILCYTEKPHFSPVSS